MPECRKCRRVQPTAEVRRTKLGYLCKDNGPGTRCWTIELNLRAATRMQRLEERRGERSAGAAA